MADARHSRQAPDNGGIHVLQHWAVADATARQALSVSSTDIGRVARQASDATFWLLTGSNATTDWLQIGAASSGGGADSAAAYVVLNATSSLSNERVLTGTNGLTLTDGGAGNAVTLQLDGTVARVSGSRFQGNITVTGTGSFESGLSGSLTRLTDGRSFLVGIGAVTITSQSNGQITISGSGGGGTSDAQFLVLSTHGTLTDERVFTPGSGLTAADAGAGSTYTLGADGTVARISGSRFVEVSTSGTGSFELGISGSHTRLSDGRSAFVAGSLVSIASSSNGQVTFSVSDSNVATISGSRFSGNIDVVGTGSFISGLSGSLTRLTDGTSFIAAGSNITVSSASNGQIVISGQAGGGGGDTGAAYVVLNATASLSNERVLTGTNGIVLSDAGAGAAVTLQLDGTVPRISGSHFTGNISSAGTGSFALGLSGSLTRLTSGISAFTHGTLVTVASSSNGQVTISISDSQVATVSGTRFSGNIETVGTASFIAGLSGSHTRLTDGTSAFIAGTNITVTSASNGAVTIAGATQVDGTFVRVSGSHMTGDLSVAGTGSFASGISGSLTRLTNGTSYLVGGSNITVSSASNGQVTISSAGGGVTDAQYVVLTANGSLTDERILVLTGGLSGTDGGAGGNITLQAVPETDQFILAMQVFS